MSTEYSNNTASETSVAQTEGTASDIQQLAKIVEAALLAADRPLNISQLRELFSPLEQPDPGQLREALALLEERCQDRGIELQEVASGFRFQVRAELQPWISRLWTERPKKYSRALLETLALVAYRQPITRAEIEDVRGVSVSTNIIQTLLERDWIRELGQRDVPGRPMLYGTTKTFLDYFQLKSLKDLPTLAEIQDIETLEPEFEFNAPKAANDDASNSETAKTTNADAETPATADSNDAKLSDESE